MFNFDFPVGTEKFKPKEFTPNSFGLKITQSAIESLMHENSVHKEIIHFVLQMFNFYAYYNKDDNHNINSNNAP